MGWFWVNPQMSSMLEVFVPAWGWVGSCQKVTIWSIEESFRPRVGMGWFVMSDEEIQLRDDFRPRLGMGWFYERI